MERDVQIDLGQHRPAGPMELIVAFGDLLLKSFGKVSSLLLWREVGYTVPRQWLCSARASGRLRSALEKGFFQKAIILTVISGGG